MPSVFKILHSAYRKFSSSKILTHQRPNIKNAEVMSTNGTKNTEAISIEYLSDEHTNISMFIVIITTISIVLDLTSSG